MQSKFWSTVMFVFAIVGLVVAVMVLLPTDSAVVPGASVEAALPSRANHLLQVNEVFYPSARAVEASRSRDLLAVNEHFYPSGAVRATSAERLRNLNDQLYPAHDSAASSVLMRGRPY